MFDETFLFKLGKTITFSIFWNRRILYVYFAANRDLLALLFCWWKTFKWFSVPRKFYSDSFAEFCCR